MVTATKERGRESRTPLDIDFTAIGNWIYVRPEIQGEYKSKGGIVVPETALPPEGTIRGEIMAVGEKAANSSPALRPGNWAIYEKMHARLSKIDGEEFHVLTKDVIFAVCPA